MVCAEGVVTFPVIPRDVVERAQHALDHISAFHIKDRTHPAIIDLKTLIDLARAQHGEKEAS